ncbi:MAG: ATPase [Spirochaetia bacterium]|nr:ATPase [Spirochaetia bacterium]
MATDRTIAVLSGKGGTGKTLVSVNLAACAENATYIDCDTEEPNGHLFLKPTITEQQTIFSEKPVVDQSKCTACGRCVKACAFNALALVGKNLLIFNEVCHSCGLCSAICKQQALVQQQYPIGTTMQGTSKNLKFYSGQMKIGESSAVPIIKALLKEKHKGIIIIDSPPGSGCLVTETIDHADFCLLVAEPTIFGAHNLAMVHELVTLMGKQCAVLLNKTQAGVNPSEEYAKEHNLPILGSLAYDEHLAQLSSNALLACEEEERYRQFFSNLLKEVLDASDPHTQR